MHKIKPINLKHDKEIYKPGEINILYDNLSNNKQNLYIVSTPLQLLSAIEAQHHFKTQNNVLVILFFVIGNGSGINQMFELSEKFPYSKLITFQNSYNRNFFAFNSYLKELNKSKYHYLFFGYTSPLYRRMVANTKYEKLFFLDDGMRSIQVHKQLFKDGEKLSTPFLRKPIKRKLYHAINMTYGNKMETDLRDLNFFTSCDLNSYENEEIVKHDYRYLIKLFSEDVTLLERYVLLINDNGWQGNTKLINLKDKVSVENRRYITRTGDKLYIYPYGIENKRYERKVLNFLNSKENLYFNSEFESDDDQMEKLQLSLLFFDALGFDKNVNAIIQSHIARITALLSSQEDIKIEEFISLLKTLNQVMRLFFYATNYFILHKEYFIKMDNFYKLFDLIILYDGKIQKKYLLMKEKLS